MLALSQWRACHRQGSCRNVPTGARGSLAANVLCVPHSLALLRAVQVLESVRLGTLAKGVAAGALWSGSDKRKELARRGFARHVSGIQVRARLQDVGVRGL